jgi:hypothetical protein
MFLVVMLASMSKVTRILSAIERGELRTAEQLLPLVYDELRKLAAQKLAQERPRSAKSRNSLRGGNCLKDTLVIVENQSGKGLSFVSPDGWPGGNF